MRPLLDMDTIQIEITNACVNACANCTRLVGHWGKPLFMELDFFKESVDSLVNFPKMVGIMGGEPLLHPHFEEMALYLKSRFPNKLQCGLWTTLPKGKEKYAPLITEVFGSVLLNDHSVEDLYHAPVLVAADEVVPDKFTMWYLIHHCWLQNNWSASITPKGAFFCEVAAAIDLLFDGPGGWPVELDWWKKTPKDYVSQMESNCVKCGVALPLHSRQDRDGIDDVSFGTLERLVKVGSPKVQKGLTHLYTEGFTDKNYNLNSFRQNEDYFQRVAAKYNLTLKVNALGYLQPFLKDSP